jgi:hypothetical protein
VDDRYEPLPGIPELPRWFWRKTGPRLRIALALALVAGALLTVALVTGLRESAHERDSRERRQRAELRTQLIRKLQAEQRPRTERSSSAAPPGASSPARLRARAGLIDEVSTAMLADARRRVRLGALEGPISKVVCEPYPRAVDGIGAERDLSRRRGRYACVAVTSEFKRSQTNIGGVLGYPYRALVDFHSGRYAYCKISGRPGPTSDPKVTTPRRCGG